MQRSSAISNQQLNLRTENVAYTSKQGRLLHDCLSLIHLAPMLLSRFGAA